MKNNWDITLAQKGIKTGTGDDNITSSQSWSRAFSGSTLTAEDRKRRIHGVINIEEPYPVRTATFYRNDFITNGESKSALKEIKQDEPGLYGNVNLNNAEQREAMIRKVAKSPPDPLFANIESEPINDTSGASSSVHQIIININSCNGHYYKQPSDVYAAGEDKDDYIGDYKYRPMVFYYTGPEKDMKGGKVQTNMKTYLADDGRETVRDSFPVIINMNEDFRGIFFFPNSPVVLNGNGKNFQGYIIAKEFVMLKKYKYDYYEEGAGGGDFLHDEVNDVYYDKSILMQNFHGELVRDSDLYQVVNYDGQEKYILKTDLANYAASLSENGFMYYNNSYYSGDELNTADTLAYVSGNGRVNYYYTLSQKKNENWSSEQSIEEANAVDWIYQGTGYFNRKDSSVFQTFDNTWKYNNNGTAGGKGVWRAREVLPNGNEGEWLDAMEGNSRNRFLLKVKESYTPDNFYATAEELLQSLGGYTRIGTSDHWIKDDATEYMKIIVDGQTFYIPKDGSVTLHDGNESAAPDAVLVKYWQGGIEKSGYADLSDNPEKYYLSYQRDSLGNTTTNNPMFVDEWGNVQYKLEQDTDGNNRYKTINPTITSGTFRTADPSLTLYEDETFGVRYNFLLDTTYFDKTYFNLANSVFDSFYMMNFDHYNHLNKQGDLRSINNIFTTAESEKIEKKPDDD